MKKINVALFAAFFLLLSGCASVTKDIVVDSAKDPKVNLSGYKTYAWLGAANFLNDPNGSWEPPKFDLAGDIKYLIDREMKKRGITLVEAQDADLAVAFFVGVDMDAQKLKKDPKTKVEMLKNIPKGALVVALVDAETGYVVWIGKATADVQQGATTEVVQERLDYAISQMFKGMK
jgi:PBP1b-binding outer membrane lipoprotein LpoB